MCGEVRAVANVNRDDGQDVAGGDRAAAQAPACVVIRGGSGARYEGKQRLTYFEGVSAESAGAQGLCLTYLQIPPGGRSAVHLHAEHESAAYLITGRVEMLHGDGLRERVEMGPGDFVYIPAGAPHLVRNASQTEPATGLLARTDPHEQESVVLLPDLEAAASDA
jgi:uncharacterized RmlC-like cupin family protein